MIPKEKVYLKENEYFGTPYTITEARGVGNS